MEDMKRIEYGIKKPASGFSQMTGLERLVPNTFGTVVLGNKFLYCVVDVGGHICLTLFYV